MMTGPVLAAGPQTRVTGVWSRTAAHARRARRGSCHVPAFDDRRRAARQRATRSRSRSRPARSPTLAARAARAGKTLLLEKPLGDDVAGAQAIVDAVGDTGVGALVMLSNRFNPALDDVLRRGRRASSRSAGAGCFISGAFLGGPFAHGWRLERGPVLDIGLVIWVLDIQIVRNLVPRREEGPKVGNLLVRDGLVTDAESTRIARRSFSFWRLPCVRSST